MQTTRDDTARWQPRPWVAALLRAFVLVAPIACSVAFVHVASGLIAPPGGSELWHVAWWVGLSAAATLVLIAIDRVTRRLLPLAALLKLALVFPDEAPSRFRTALGAGTTADLEKRLAAARAGAASDTPVEAAERLLGFVAALRTHDHITRGHSERVRAYAQLIAKELHLGRDEIDRLNWAALLHDIGKLEVPAEILNKAGRPSDEEWHAIRSHPELGARLAEPLRAWLGEWTDAIADHHERWDGKGYPRGLEGEDISLAGRIVAVADVFDVITSARSYKEQGDPGAARGEIANCSGEQFDPRVARAFLGISLGRLRLAMGPLSWLAQAPVLGRIPFTPGIATAASSAVAVVGALAAGLVGGQSVPASLTPAAQAAAAPAAGRVASQVTTIPAAIRAPGSHGGAATAFSPLAPLMPIAAPSAAAPALQPAAAVLPEPAAPAPPPPPPPVQPGAPGPGSPPPASPPPPAPSPPPPPAPAPPPPPVVAPPAPPPPPVNDPPSFTAGSDQAGFEDSGPQSVTPWAQAIRPGPPDEAGQTVSFVVSSDRPSLFAAGGQPAVTPAGTLTYTPAADASGTATVSVRAVDDGGTADGGSDTSAAQTFQIVVAPVNDVPGFTAGGDQSVLENAGPQSVPGWATAITSGPADEAGQVVSFAVSSSDTTLFTTAGQPAVAADGTLTFEGAPGVHGAAIVTVRAVDDGGTAAGGVDTSASQTFLLTIVNQGPTANADAAVTLENDAGGVTFNVLANDTDPESDPLSVSSYDDSTIANGGLTDNGGGSFTYVPAAHFAGTDTFSYTASDGNGGTATGVVTITVTAVPDPPAAADDAFVTTQGVALVQGAPGVLANDSDSGGGALVVDTTPVAGPANGSLALAADGSFTYTPSPGFTGSDAFTYRVTSAVTTLSATAVATITVTAATFSTSLLYLTPSGPTSELWNMSTASPPPALLLVPDYDGDLQQGLTIKSGDGKDKGEAQEVADLALASGEPARAQRPGDAASLELSQREGHGVRLSLRLHRGRSGVHADRVRNALRQLLERPPHVGAARHLGRHREHDAGCRARAAAAALRRRRRSVGRDDRRAAHQPHADHSVARQVVGCARHAGRSLRSSLRRRRGAALLAGRALRAGAVRPCRGRPRVRPRDRRRRVHRPLGGADREGARAGARRAPGRGRARRVRCHRAQRRLCRALAHARPPQRPEPLPRGRAARARAAWEPRASPSCTRLSPAIGSTPATSRPACSGSRPSATSSTRSTTRSRSSAASAAMPVRSTPRRCGARSTPRARSAASGIATPAACSIRSRSPTACGVPCSSSACASASAHRSRACARRAGASSSTARAGACAPGARCSRPARTRRSCAPSGGACFRSTTTCS